MKKIKIIVIYLVACLAIQSCFHTDSNDSESNNEKHLKMTTDKLNDTTIEFSYWKDSLNANCFLVSKLDTIERYTYTSSNEYRNYTYFNKKGIIYKIKQFVAFPNEIKLNEIIYLNDVGEISDEKSFYIKAEILNDSIKLTAFPTNYFNKIVVVVSDGNTFNKQKWVKTDTLKLLKKYIVLSKKYIGQKCLLQAIKTDKFGADESGKDYYFDFDNLICRDIKKSLICNDIH